MWRIPPPLIAGGQEGGLYIVSDTWIGNLWDWMGQPAEAIDIVLTADNCDVGGVYIPGDFNPGCTFQLNGVANGRFVGAGGNGGAGGDDQGNQVTSGGSGTRGGHAVSCESGFTINIDIDAGFLLGGGGGGGGSAGNDLGATSDAGGGGGGGQGFTGQGCLGGTGGTGTPSNASPGTDGDATGIGLGGAGADTSTTSAAGGDGGLWGRSGTHPSFPNGGYLDMMSGSGGDGGNAFAPISGSCSVNFNGTSTETQLRSQGRIKGETQGFIVAHGRYTNYDIFATIGELGFIWESDGDLVLRNEYSGNTTLSDFYWRDTWAGTAQTNFVAANYEIAMLSGSWIGQTWQTIIAADDTYVALTSSREMSIDTLDYTGAGQIVAIRRAAAAEGDAEPIAQGFYRAEMEDDTT